MVDSEVDELLVGHPSRREIAQATIIPIDLWSELQPREAPESGCCPNLTE